MDQISAWREALEMMRAFLIRPPYRLVNMPIDFTSLLLAFALWIGGTGYAYTWIRATTLARHDVAVEGPLPAVRPIFWTMWVSIALAVLGIFVIWLHEWIFNRA